MKLKVILLLLVISASSQATTLEKPMIFGQANEIKENDDDGIISKMIERQAHSENVLTHFLDYKEKLAESKKESYCSYARYVLDMNASIRDIGDKWELNPIDVNQVLVGSLQYGIHFDIEEKVKNLSDGITRITNVYKDFENMFVVPEADEVNLKNCPELSNDPKGNKLIENIKGMSEFESQLHPYTIKMALAWKNEINKLVQNNKALVAAIKKFGTSASTKVSCTLSCGQWVENGRNVQYTQFHTSGPTADYALNRAAILCESYKSIKNWKKGNLFGKIQYIANGQVMVQPPKVSEDCVTN